MAEIRDLKTMLSKVNYSWAQEMAARLDLTKEQFRNRKPTALLEEPALGKLRALLADRRQEIIRVESVIAELAAAHRKASPKHRRLVHDIAPLAAEYRQAIGLGVWDKFSDPQLDSFYAWLHSNHAIEHFLYPNGVDGFSHIED